MYPSQEARDADIDELAAVGSAELRERFLAGDHRASRTPSSRCPRAAGWVTSAGWPRVGSVSPASAIPGMRHREVEIHHADLGAGYGPGHWPEEFLDEMFDRAVHDRADGPGALLRTPDGETRWASATDPWSAAAGST